MGHSKSKSAQNNFRVYRGVLILKIDGIGEVFWAVRNSDGTRREDVNMFNTLKAAKTFIDAELSQQS